MYQSLTNYLSNLWNKRKTNEYIKQYITDYPEKHLTERSFIFGVLGTLYPDEMKNLVKKAFDNRKLHYREEEELIEVTQEFKDILDEI